MLKLFFIVAAKIDKGGGEWGPGGGEEPVVSTWTPKSLITLVLLEEHVLELCPTLPQCEHFLPIEWISKEERERKRWCWWWGEILGFM